jgi:hypothetical protein
MTSGRSLGGGSEPAGADAGGVALVRGAALLSFLTVAGADGEVRDVGAAGAGARARGRQALHL